jgi:hypothetical protein
VADLEYETRDVNVRVMAKVGLGFALLAATGAAVSLGVYLFIAKLHEGRERPAAPLAQEQGRQPALPRLQSTPQRDLEELRAHQRRELTSYGWVNQQAGTARIDIEEAMRLYVERAAARPSAAGGAPAHLEVPAEAAGPSGTATMPPVAPAPSPSATRRPRSQP